MRKGAVILNKRQRQDYLRGLISKEQIGTQDELLYWLQKAGIQVTQSTISRDIHEMGIVKVRGEDGYLYYALPESIALRSQYLEFEHLVHENVLSIRHIEFVIVLRTVIDMANIIAAIIDEGIFEETVGTVAGADTIAIFCHNQEASQTLANRLEKMRQGDFSASEH